MHFCFQIDKMYFDTKVKGRQIEGLNTTIDNPGNHLHRLRFDVITKGLSHLQSYSTVCVFCTFLISINTYHGHYLPFSLICNLIHQ